MKVRSCWTVLENRVEKRLAQLQADTGQALRVRESLLGSRQRLDHMLGEYQAQTVVECELATDDKPECSVICCHMRPHHAGH